MENETTLENKIAILATLWIEYRQDEEFIDFIEYNDIGLPLAYAIDNKMATATEMGIGFINETFALLLGSLDLEDIGFETLDELLDTDPVE